MVRYIIVTFVLGVVFVGGSVFFGSHQAYGYGYSPLHRFWSDQKQSHFYTADASEKDYIIANYDDNVWNYEGVANYVFMTEGQDTVPVYRFWSDIHQGHFYTASEIEKNYIIENYAENVWKYEGTAYYAYLSSKSATKPVYRFWSAKNKHHFYTVSEAEKDYIIATYDEHVWSYERIAWYVPS